METVVVVTTTKTVLLPLMGPVGIGLCVAGAIGAIAIPLIVSAIQSGPSEDQGNGNRNSKNTNTSNKSCPNNEKTRRGEPRRRSTSRDRSNRVSDFESSSHDRDEFSDSEEFDHRSRSPANHIVDRIIRLFRLSPLVRRVANTLQIPRENVVLPGPSQFQDHSSRRGVDFPAAHVIAIRIYPDVLCHRDLECVTALINFLGHTQNVPRFANINRVGRRIDELQKKLIKRIINIDFSGTFTEEEEIQINDIIKMFINMLHGCYAFCGEEEIEAINEAIMILQEITPESVFEQTKEACFGGGMDNYRHPRRDGRKRE